ncbi:hypothetical protein OIU85_027044 [Salix viminalis]|uniref:Uncharacterized protein n=1 Tax=Salix viminalis TaxID=40686 RepID=A0A9Q0YZK4_SALVM|nr:hypothetical protein OIU85_027044 [Salix viminalis]
MCSLDPSPANSGSSQPPLALRSRLSPQPPACPAPYHHLPETVPCPCVVTPAPLPQQTNLFAIDPAQPVLATPLPLRILGKGPIASADDQPHSPILSSADSSCAEESDDGESSSYAGSSSSGDTSDLEPMSAPHSPLVQLGLVAVQNPEQGPIPPQPFGAAIAAKNGGSVANKESVAGHASRVDSAAPGSIQPDDPMFAEIDAAAGGWEQVRKKHRSNKYSRKKSLVAAADASAGQTVLADKSKSDAVLNGLNSELWLRVWLRLLWLTLPP